VIKKILVAVLLLAAVGLAGRFVGLAAGGDKPAPAGDAPLAGKFLIVSTTSAFHGYDAYASSVPGMETLEKAQIKQLGGKQFLVGKYLNINPNDSRPGGTLWIAVESIVGIREFDSAEDAKAYLQPAPAVCAPAPVFPVPQAAVPAPPAPVPQAAVPTPPASTLTPPPGEQPLPEAMDRYRTPAAPTR